MAIFTGQLFSQGGYVKGWFNCAWFMSRQFSIIFQTVNQYTNCNYKNLSISIA